MSKNPEFTTKQAPDSAALWGDGHMDEIRKRRKKPKCCKRGLIPFYEDEPYGDTSIAVQKGMQTCRCWRGKAREVAGAVLKFASDKLHWLAGYAYGLYSAAIGGGQDEQYDDMPF